MVSAVAGGGGEGDIAVGAGVLGALTGDAVLLVILLGRATGDNVTGGAEGFVDGDSTGILVVVAVEGFADGDSTGILVDVAAGTFVALGVDLTGEAEGISTAAGDFVGSSFPCPSLQSITRSRMLAFMVPFS